MNVEKLRDKIAYMKNNECHYTVLSSLVSDYRKSTKGSERKIAFDLSISKSEIHRLLVLSTLNADIHAAARRYRVEKYVLLEANEFQGRKKEVAFDSILNGRLIKRKQLKWFKY